MKRFTAAAIVVALLAVAVGPYASRRARFLAAFVAGADVPFNDEHCALLGGPQSADPMVGSEDFAHWRDGVVFVSAGDLRMTFAGTSPAPGAIYAIDLASQSWPPPHRGLHAVVASTLPTAFQPHGIYYSSATRRLFVVSHGLARGGGSRIRIFRVLGDSFATLALEHERDVTSPAFPNGAINDVVEGASPNELYVTVFIPCGLPPAGAAFASFLSDGACEVLRALQVFVPLTRVLHCELDAAAEHEPRTAARCTVASSGYFMVNGIARSEDTGEIFVVDTMDAAVTVLRPQSDGTLVWTGAIALPAGVCADNIDYDNVGQRLVIGANPAMAQSMAFISNPKDDAAAARDPRCGYAHGVGGRRVGRARRRGNPLLHGRPCV